MERKKFIIIDASATLHRSWHAIPKLTDPKGRIINAVYGFTVLLLKLIREQNPEYIVVALDTKGPTFRHKKYKEYKAGRTKQPQEFYDQFPIMKKVLDCFSIPYFEKKGLEADDIIGTITNKINKKNTDFIIISSDADLFQLINKNSFVYYLGHGISKAKIYKQKDIIKKFGILPEQLVEMKALTGDPSDNIKGIKGIGLKTATNLIKEFKNIENLYKYLKKQETMSSKKPCLPKPLVELLIKNKKNAYLSKELVTIEKNIKKLSLDKIKPFNETNLNEIKKIFEKLGFNNLLKKIAKQGLGQKNKLF
ncbi:hypothetical protein ISS06_02530 [Patescibacteria group bacterium]|nr:hypothetical protein [Patescibacteria group bacterium]